MVARGDLGVEMNPWDVPVIQKRIVETCKAQGKPVVIATQMMESMIENPTPTRAEASDCATAIFDSSDAVMLSAESAAGKYPVESVTMQQLIINRVEDDYVYKESLLKFQSKGLVGSSSIDVTSASIIMAARQVAAVSESKALIVFTRTGRAAERVAMLRPTVPVLAATYEKSVARYLAMVWGVYPLLLDKPENGEFLLEEEVYKACRAASAEGFLSSTADLVTVTAGLPFFGNDPIACPTNTLRVVSVETSRVEAEAAGIRCDVDAVNNKFASK
jgi:pyruvate kinase